MAERFSTFLSKFLEGSNDQFVLIILIILIILFTIICVALFFITLYLRFKNSVKERQDQRLQRLWDPIILDVMDNTISALDGFRKIKRKYSISYLLYLEKYIDLVKGSEKEYLITLGRLSTKKLFRYLRSNDREKLLYGIHMLGLFHPEEQYKYVKFYEDDVELSLNTIREMCTVDDLKIKERLLKLLFLFKYISPIYISNILVEMGNDIVPLLRLIIIQREEVPYEQTIAIETIRRMHYAGCLDLSDRIMKTTVHPGVLSNWLRYLEEFADGTYRESIEPLITHSNAGVRMAAIRAYIAVSDTISTEDIRRFFNDESVMVAIQTAEKLKENASLPYISMREIDKYRWADIYKRMVY